MRPALRTLRPRTAGATGDVNDNKATTAAAAGPQTLRLLAFGRAAATRAKDDARSNKDADVEANWRALKVGAGRQARKPAEPRKEETVGVQGHHGGAPY